MLYSIALKILVLCCTKSLQSCPTLCNPMNCSPPGSSVHGILQARILEWVAMPSSRGSSQLRDQTWISYVYLHWQVGSLPLVPPGKSLKKYLFSTISSVVSSAVNFYDSLCTSWAESCKLHFPDSLVIHFFQVCPMGNWQEFGSTEGNREEASYFLCLAITFFISGLPNSFYNQFPELNFSAWNI